MFYCDACARKRHWPVGLVRSSGRCEVCGKSRECTDVLSSLLPPAPPRSQVEVPPQHENPDYEAYFKD